MNYVTLRGSIYVAIAVFVAFGGWLNDLTPERIGTLTWLDWCGMGVSVGIGALNALRSFIDGSAERKRNGNGNLLATNINPPTETKS